jgi:hypothetical protein
MKRDNYQCRECKRFGRTTQAEMVHHVFPLENYPNHKLTDNNLIACCNNCHNTFHDRNGDNITDQGKHWQRKLKETIGITDEQMIDVFRVVIVWGSPASGKTTYVRENMIPGDLVVDLDYLKQAISLQPKTSPLPNLMDVSLSIRSHIYDLISKRESIKAETVWVVAGLPKLKDREYLFSKLRANEIIRIDTSKEYCIKRAMED